MKIIHTADIHLGSKLEAKFPKEIRDMRKKEIRETFTGLTEYAKDHGIKTILLSGDIFDSDKPSHDDHTFFYGLVRTNPEIVFYYLKGNHDQQETNEEIPSNLKMFSNTWTSYDLGEDVIVSGIEICKENSTSLYSTLSLDKNKNNIVMLHGQIGQDSDKATEYGINLKKLAGKNIDYLALGHIHKAEEGKLDERGHYAYCGILEPRGFDEVGKHGFMIYDTKTRKNEFISFCKREIKEINVDVSDVKTDFEAGAKIRSAIPKGSHDIYRVNLVGDVDMKMTFDPTLIAEEYAKGCCFFLNVKDKTGKKINVDEYRTQVSLKGEFVRKVMGDDTLNEEEKKEIIAIGLKALMGEEVK